MTVCGVIILAIDLCRSQPATCAALLGSLDPAALARILSPASLTAPGVGESRHRSDPTFL